MTILEYILYCSSLEELLLLALLLQAIKHTVPAHIKLALVVIDLGLLPQAIAAVIWYFIPTKYLLGFFGSLAAIKLLLQLYEFMIRIIFFN
jgi:hypothetical protein